MPSLRSRKKKKRPHQLRADTAFAAAGIAVGGGVAALLVLLLAFVTLVHMRDICVPEGDLTPAEAAHRGTYWMPPAGGDDD